MSLKYTGKGRHIVGVPATDLTDDEIADLAKRRDLDPAELRKDLIASGVYAPKEKGK